MNTTVANLETPRKPPAEAKPAVRTEAPSPPFNFSRTRQEKLFVPARYLILLRRQHEGRSGLSLAFRSRPN